MIHLKRDRMLCWDSYFIDQSTDISIEMNKPTPRELAIRCNEEWDGNCNGYGGIEQQEDGFYFRYRALEASLTKTEQAGFCLMKSADGKHFEPVTIDRVPFHGSTHNNLFHNEKRRLDNFSVFIDNNPACLPHEKFKALSQYVPLNDDGELDHVKAELWLYTSPDGITFQFSRKLEVEGQFDSYNVLIWDENIRKYHLYLRGYSRHPQEGKPKGVRVREIWHYLSEDLHTFEKCGPLDFGENAPLHQLYTNQIIQYPRARSMFLGFPTRYKDRLKDEDSLHALPAAEYRARVIDKMGRAGHAFTDCVIMTSRDGQRFDRREEAFLTPGIEAACNWWYGDCYPAYGLIETTSDIEGAPNEYSFYMGENYRVKKVQFRRYTIRLDGFFCWRGSYRGAEVLSKPFTFEGEELEVNFASSALGGLDILLCDTEGTPLEGYAALDLFGDSVERKVHFEKDLALLNGKPLRMKIRLRDCALYSFKFN
ncbi:MAG: hypothetical protein IKM48_00030 [Clostridia bacterium]|nr:hypothetical protein [Clostridia bacterium]